MGVSRPSFWKRQSVVDEASSCRMASCLSTSVGRSLDFASSFSNSSAKICRFTVIKSDAFTEIVKSG